MTLKTPIINIMTKAAYKAGNILIKDFREVENLQVSKKGIGDFVTSADLNSEKTIIKILEKAYPEIKIISEETNPEINLNNHEKKWIIDPLDGTLNFLHGLPHFAISIALMVNEEIISGIIYDPIKDELFWAEKGVGAFLNNKRIRVSGRRHLKDALVSTGIPWKGMESSHKNYLKILENIMKNKETDNFIKKSYTASHFSASLELAKEGVINIRQHAPFAPIYIKKKAVKNDKR